MASTLGKAFRVIHYSKMNSVPSVEREILTRYRMNPAHKEPIHAWPNVSESKCCTSKGKSSTDESAQCLVVDRRSSCEFWGSY
jgi:hypothetical protein